MGSHTAEHLTQWLLKVAAATSSFDKRNADGPAVSFGCFTKKFKYLGSTIESSLTLDADVDERTKAATSAFGALKNALNR